MTKYRIVGMGMAVIFSLVGVVFLLFPGTVLEFFNTISAAIGMEPSPVTGPSFYLILAVGYMYLVALLAFRMYQQPDNPSFPFLLAHAKLASSVLSFGFFILSKPYLIYLANGIVDGSIGLFVLLLYRRLKKKLP